MPPNPTPNARVIITGPVGVEDLTDFSPMEAEELGETIFCCFFKTMDQRTEFLERLRAIATQAGPPENPEAGLTLKEEVGLLAKQGDATGVLLASVRWWVTERRKPYHAYRLKAEYSPYNTSCAVAFAEIDPTTLKLSVLRALQVLEQEKARVMDFFGLEADD